MICQKCKTTDAVRGVKKIAILGRLNSYCDNCFFENHKTHALSDGFLDKYPAWHQLIKDLNLVSIYTDATIQSQPRSDLQSHGEGPGESARRGSSIWPEQRLGADLGDLGEGRRRGESSFQNLVQQGRNGNASCAPTKF
jgi:hypothetical protein